MALQAYNDNSVEETEQESATYLLSHDGWGRQEDSQLPTSDIRKDDKQATAEIYLDFWGRQEQHKKSSLNYNEDSSYWGKNEEYASGSFTLNTSISFPDIDNDQDDFDQEAYDRVILLAKKYASDNVSLGKEDNARLQMINQKMDLKYPRYSAKDWQLLEDATDLIKKLSANSGEKS